MRFRVGQRFYYDNTIAKVVAVCDRPPNDHYCLVECKKGFEPPDDEMWYINEGQWVVSGSIHNLNKFKRYAWIFEHMILPSNFVNYMLMDTE